MIKRTLLGALLSLSAGLAMAGSQSLQNTSITGNYSFADNTLASIDYLIDNSKPFNVAALDEIGVEFLTNDDNNTFGIDFSPSGLVTFYSALPDAWTTPANQVFTFSFAGLSESIVGFNLGDTSQITGGLTPGDLSVLSPNSISLDVSNVSFGPSASFSAQLLFAAPVPEPSEIAQLGIGLALLAGLATLRRRNV